MSSKFRPLYLITGALGLFSLLFYVLSNVEDIDLMAVIAIAVPDMFFFYLAYLTYPPDIATNRPDNY
jgi:hypothetical protein